jgi:stage IV sporulation protein FB
VNLSLVFGRWSSFDLADRSGWRQPTESHAMFCSCSPTPFDWNFELFGFRIRVHPMFWLLALLFSHDFQNRRPPYMNMLLTGIGVSCIFVSILVHELGHAFLIRYEGFRPEIVLHGFGGYALYHPYRAISPGMKMLISFAGPGAGFIFYGIVILIKTQLMQLQPGRVPYPVWYALGHLEYINLWWGVFNLLPIYPLDGGQIARVWMENRWRFSGLTNSLSISIVLSAGMALWSFHVSGNQLLSWNVMLFASLCYENIQEYQQLRFGHRW